MHHGATGIYACEHICRVHTTPVPGLLVTAGYRKGDGCVAGRHRYCIDRAHVTRGGSLEAGDLRFDRHLLMGEWTRDDLARTPELARRARSRRDVLRARRAVLRL